MLAGIRILKFLFLLEPLETAFVVEKAYDFLQSSKDYNEDCLFLVCVYGCVWLYCPTFVRKSCKTFLAEVTQGKQVFGQP